MKSKRKSVFVSVLHAVDAIVREATYCGRPVANGGPS
jgi:hypothetical protein